MPLLRGRHVSKDERQQKKAVLIRIEFPDYRQGGCNCILPVPDSIDEGSKGRPRQEKEYQSVRLRKKTCTQALFPDLRGCYG